eukprot:2779318-Pleurochrysis_carterae.AAC.2
MSDARLGASCNQAQEVLPTFGKMALQTSVLSVWCFKFLGIPFLRGNLCTIVYLLMPHACMEPQRCDPKARLKKDESLWVKVEAAAMLECTLVSRNRIARETEGTSPAASNVGSRKENAIESK